MHEILLRDEDRRNVVGVCFSDITAGTNVLLQGDAAPGIPPSFALYDPLLSKKMRSVSLNDAAIEVLAQVGTELKWDYVFVNRRRGAPYTTVMKVRTRLRKKAGLPHLRSNDLRHQFAPFLANHGRTLFEIQTILGHSHPIVTQRYAHLSSKSMQAAANTVSVAIRGAMREETEHVPPAEDGGAVPAQP